MARQHAKKNPSAEEVIAHLRFNSPYLNDLVDLYNAGIDALQRTASNILEGDMLLHLKQLPALILDLSIHDYTLLMGTFNFHRMRTDAYDLREELRLLLENTESEACEAFLRKLLGVVEGAWTLAERRHEEEREENTGFLGKLAGSFKKKEPELGFSQEFASDALLVLRTIYPAGVNMVSPGWDDEYTSYDAEHTVSVRMVVPHSDDAGGSTIYHDRLEVVPYGRGVSMISYTPTHEVTHAFPIMIRNGESLLIGRNLGIKELFSMARRKNPLMLVEVKGTIKDPNVSRAGMMIFRHKNRIYIFNRGSMNNYALEEKVGNDQITMTDFSAKTVVEEGGFHSFGVAEQTVFGSAGKLRQAMEHTLAEESSSNPFANLGGVAEHTLAGNSGGAETSDHLTVALDSLSDESGSKSGPSMADPAAGTMIASLSSLRDASAMSGAPAETVISASPSDSAQQTIAEQSLKKALDHESSIADMPLPELSAGKVTEEPSITVTETRVPEGIVGEVQTVTPDEVVEVVSPEEALLAESVEIGGSSVRAEVIDEEPESEPTVEDKPQGGDAFNAFANMFGTSLPGAGPDVTMAGSAPSPVSNPTDLDKVDTLETEDEDAEVISLSECQTVIHSPSNVESSNEDDEVEDAELLE